MADLTAKCKSCQRPIVWVKMVSGKAMPCDPPIITVITDAQPGMVVKGRVSHFVTCPNPSEHRRK